MQGSTRTRPRTEPSTEPYDVITMGRIGVDLYPLQTGVPLAQVEHVREVPRRLGRPTSRSPPPGSAAARP